ncbi:hypothetical protein C0431_12945 [bacterium]|nr:hypothetical protein [bacterium]
MNDINQQARVLDMMEADGYILEIVPHNQLAENEAQAEEIRKGWMKKISFTATIYDSEIEDLIDARSFDTFPLALDWAIGWYILKTKQV